MVDASKPASLLDKVRDMGKELKLEGEDLEHYVNQHMEKAGWKRETNWSPPDGKDASGQPAQGQGWFK
jgi:hypothetical protein